MKGTISLQAPTCNNGWPCSTVGNTNTELLHLRGPAAPRIQTRRVCDKHQGPSASTAVRCCVLALPLSNSLDLQDEGMTPMTASVWAAKLPGMSLLHHVELSKVNAILSVAYLHVYVSPTLLSDAFRPRGLTQVEPQETRPSISAGGSGSRRNQPSRPEPLTFAPSLPCCTGFVAGLAYAGLPVVSS